MNEETIRVLAASEGIELAPERAGEIAAELAALLAVLDPLAAGLVLEDEPTAFTATLERLAAPAEDGA